MPGPCPVKGKKMRLSALLRPALVGLALCLGGAAAGRECAGTNVIEAMSATDRAELRARTDAAPFARGNFWKATREGQTIWLVGTYHLDDPRHLATTARLRPLIEAAGTVLVEAGPDEEKALMKRMAEDPSVMTITDGPTMVDLLSPHEWTEMTAALKERNIPPFMAAKFRPWYLTVVLAIPSCKMPTSGQTRGLDGLVMQAASEAGRPLKALEPYDTVFAIFGEMSEDEQLALVRSTLATLDRAEDYSKTLADAYFAEDSRLAWEMTRDLTRELATPEYPVERAMADFDRMEEVLMSGRNRNWIPVIEAAAEDGPVVAAFGALHLSGEEGVLNLLAKDGWTLERLAL